MGPPDLGVYGWNRRETYEGKDAAARATAKDATLRKFERFTIEHGGFQVSMAQIVMILVLRVTTTLAIHCFVRTFDPPGPVRRDPDVI